MSRRDGAHDVKYSRSRRAGTLELQASTSCREPLSVVEPPRRDMVPSYSFLHARGVHQFPCVDSIFMVRVFVPYDLARLALGRRDDHEGHEEHEGFKERVVANRLPD